MTEFEWLMCRDPQAMLDFLRAGGRASDRKFRLFAVACCRRIWPLLTDERSRVAVETVERHGDGMASTEQMVAASVAANAAFHQVMTPACQYANHPRTAECAAALAARRCSIVEDIDWNLGAIPLAVEAVARAGSPGSERPAMEAERIAQAALLRCIFGNPFRAISTVSQAILAWNEGIIPKLARTAYEDRHLPDGTLEGTRLAVLADALEEAGCTDTLLLEHLRVPGMHVRGCFVLDAILAKS